MEGITGATWFWFLVPMGLTVFLSFVSVMKHKEKE